MKKMLSLAALLAAISYATPASAELKIGGDASLRMRSEFNAKDPGYDSNDDVMWQHRLRLNGSADLGDGYFFKTLIMSEKSTVSKTTSTDLDSDTTTTNSYAQEVVNAAGWMNTTGNEGYSLAVSQLYFGRNMENCNYVVGRIPLGSFNNPIYDLTLYPTKPVDTPVNNLNFDRLYGANYGAKIGGGKLNTTLVVLDNSSTTAGTTAYDGMMNDGYALSLAYTTTWGDVTLEPQVFAILTNATDSNVTPLTLGLNASGKVGDGKLSGAFFYTAAENDAKTADYSGYLLRVKGETGPYMAWVDYNSTSDDAGNIDYTNTFVWAQYKYTAYKSAAGSLTLQPTLRYRATSKDAVGTTSDLDTSQLRGEFSATVTF